LQVAFGHNVGIFVYIVRIQAALLLCFTACYFYLSFNNYFTAPWLTLVVVILVLSNAAGIASTVSFSQFHDIGKHEKFQLGAVYYENPSFLRVQIYLYYFYIGLSDFSALVLILTMAIGIVIFIDF
jgi:hypothetical protein